MKILVFTDTEKASKDDIQVMMEAQVAYVKIAVDIRENKLAGGGEFHADCEASLLQLGCKQEFIWGADWIPDTQEIKFEALINIRPRQRNPSTTVLDPKMRDKIESIARPILGQP
jgi:hypothetical protein